MAVRPLVIGLNISRYGWLRGLEQRTAWREGPRRTVYNVQKRQYEELPLWQFRELSRQGKIEETVAYSPYNGHEHKVYRLIS
jgi:hypothetical protein